MRTEYQQLTTRYRKAVTVQELDAVFHETGILLKKILQDNKPYGLAVLEHYIYFYKKLNNEEFGDGKFKGRSKEDFINRVVEKSGA